MNLFSHFFLIKYCGGFLGKDSNKVIFTTFVCFEIMRGKKQCTVDFSLKNSDTKDSRCCGKNKLALEEEEVQLNNYLHSITT